MARVEIGWQTHLHKHPLNTNFIFFTTKTLYSELRFYSRSNKKRAGRSVWYDRRVRKPSQNYPFSEKSLNWKDFEEFLLKKTSEKVAKDRLRYAQKFCYCLLNRDFSELNKFSECKGDHILLSLSALAKFLGVYVVFKQLMKAYRLKWRTSHPEDLIIARMNKVDNWQTWRSFRVDYWG